MDLEATKKDLSSRANTADATQAQRYFKTGPGEYGEGDIFLGVRVPQTRAVAKKAYRSLSLNDCQELLDSPIHEERLLALFILRHKYDKADGGERERIYTLLIKNTDRINNWDLVDSCAPYILGEYLFTRDRSILDKLVVSKNLWERRIAIMTTLYFIKHGQFDDTLRLAAQLIDDSEDLIHKATGWMLREIGNKDRHTEENFLRKHYKTMPRTMLRYAIEKFSENRRKAYLNGSV